MQTAAFDALYIPANDTPWHEDWRSITDKHVAFCTERGLHVVDVARPRGVGHGRVAVA